MPPAVSLVGLIAKVHQNHSENDDCVIAKPNSDANSQTVFSTGVVPIFRQKHPSYTTPPGQIEIAR